MGIGMDGRRRQVGRERGCSVVRSAALWAASLWSSHAWGFGRRRCLGALRRRSPSERSPSFVQALTAVAPAVSEHVLGVFDGRGESAVQAT